MISSGLVEFSPYSHTNKKLVLASNPKHFFVSSSLNIHSTSVPKYVSSSFKNLTLVLFGNSYLVIFLGLSDI